MTVLEAARNALRYEMRRNHDIWVLGQDIRRGGVFGQYHGLLEEFGPDRVVDTPIAEATMVGVAVGAAIVGSKPVVEMRFLDFALSATDEIVNQAAKVRYMSGGQGHAPILIRMPSGLRDGAGAQHSQSLEAWFAHIPGLIVTAPATPADARGLLLSALRAEDPVIHMEGKELWQIRGEVPDTEDAIPIGLGKVARAGRHLTIVSWGSAMHESLQAATTLDHFGGISAEVIDLRTLWPWDRRLVLESAGRTRRLVVVHESVRDCGLGSEIIATAAEELHETFISPVTRIASPRIPIGYSQTLEEAYRVRAARVVRTISRLFGVPELFSMCHDEQSCIVDRKDITA